LAIVFVTIVLGRVFVNVLGSEQGVEQA
jgi:hypothetical protein